MKITFYKFLKQQVNRNDPIGDLAKDMTRDLSVPEKANTLNEWEDHLMLKRACSEAVDALEEAWGEFELQNEHS